MKAFLLAVLLTIPGFSQDHSGSTLGKIALRASQVGLVVAHSLDIQSSWGKHELNPLLQSSNQTFGARGASIKIGIAGLGLVAQEILVRKRPKLTPYFTVTNFAVAGMEGLAVANNLKYPAATK